MSETSGASEVFALGAAGRPAVAPSERTPLHRRAFTLEQSPLAYGADFVVHGAAIAGLAGWLLWSGQGGHAWRVGALVLLGAVVWSGLEYALHRFVLHRVQPFRAWHEALTASRVA